MKIIVLLILFLSFEPTLGSYQTASSWFNVMSNHPEMMSCLSFSKKGLKDFLSPGSSNLLDKEKEVINKKIQAKCNAVPVRSSSFPKSVIDSIREQPLVKFILQKFEDKPDYKLAMVQQHHYLATAELDTETLLDLSDPLAYQSYALMPFWVKGDPGSSSTFCYLLHFALYFVSWLFVGAFLVDFSHAAYLSRFTPETSLLGQAAVGSQAMYSFVVLICGLAEESRTDMDTYSKCQFRKRYAINFATTMLMAVLWMLTGRSNTKRKVFTFGRARVDTEEITMGVDTLEKDPTKKVKDVIAINKLAGKTDETLKIAEAEAKKQSENDKNSQKLAAAAADADAATIVTIENGSKKDITVSETGIIQRILTRKAIWPFVASFFACLIVFALLC
eukprot:c14361_g1_i1.p1 GENE.c14361_g1_i1~~c14361_g1_i1.p1  ORF type:complete len:390 (-),score=111.46 c14361_g1_i1:81-1250(-)